MPTAAVMLKVVVVCPARTDTDEGTVSKIFVLDKAIKAPPAGAPPLSVTVQLVPARALSAVRVQDRELTVGRAPPVTTPAVPGAALPVLNVETASPFVTPIGVLTAPGAITRFTTATVPFAIVLAFIPEVTQV